jgi:hypothetical protein
MARSGEPPANTGRKQATVSQERAKAMQPAQSELGVEAFHSGSNQKTRHADRAGHNFGWLELIKGVHARLRGLWRNPAAADSVWFWMRLIESRWVS